MQIKIKKVNTNLLTTALLSVLFLILICYEVFAIYNIYKNTNIASSSNYLKVTRFNFTNYNQALANYQSASGLKSLSGFPDPFLGSSTSAPLTPGSSKNSGVNPGLNSTGTVPAASSNN